MPDRIKKEPRRAPSPGQAANEGDAANEEDAAYADGPRLPRLDKVVLVMDLVESVRLMAQDEAGVVARWQGFTRKVAKLVPRHRGRIVKSLGDGLLAEFDHARDALQVATALHKIIQPANQGRAKDQQLLLRVGLNATPVYVDNLDIYGNGVNLAARLAGLAGPGETICSVSVRDQLTDGLDADVQDMGECYLKHVDEPVRAYRIGPPGPMPVLVPEKDYATPLQPTIAVIPFASRSKEPEHFAIGELIADGVIGQLSRTKEIKVISRLSATLFRGRESPLAEFSHCLAANYVLRGSYAVTGGLGGEKFLLMAEMVETKSETVVYSERLNGQVSDLLQAESELIDTLAGAVQRAMLEVELQRALQQPMHTLQSYSLLLNGITLMHRSTGADFDRSRSIFEHLIARTPKAISARAWLAKWYVLRSVRGLSPNSQMDANIALEQVHRALEVDSSDSLALAIEGHINDLMLRKYDVALEKFEQSIARNPSESMAWLYKSVNSVSRDQTAQAVQESQRARSLSPLDPLKYFFESLTASALLADGKVNDAITAANASLKLNRHYSPTLRVLLTAQVESDRIPEARNTLSRLLQEEPDFTLKAYMHRGDSQSKTRQQCARALQRLGVA